MPGPGQLRGGLGRACGPHLPPHPSPAVISLLFTAGPARCPPPPPPSPAPGPARPPAPSPQAVRITLCPGISLRAQPRHSGRRGEAAHRSSSAPARQPRSPHLLSPQPPAVGPLTARTGGPAQGAAARHVGPEVVLPHDAHRAALLAPQLQHFLRAEHWHGGDPRPLGQARRSQGACAWRGGGGATVRGRASAEGREKIGLVVVAALVGRAEGTGVVAEARLCGAGGIQRREPGPQLRGRQKRAEGTGGGSRGDALWGRRERAEGSGAAPEGQAGAS